MRGLLGLLVLGGFAYGAHRWFSRSSDSSSSCVLRQRSLDAWANSFEPPLGVLYFPDMQGAPPSRDAFLNVPVFPGNLVVITHLGDAPNFYVYDVNGNPQLSPNLHADYCANYG